MSNSWESHALYLEKPRELDDDYQRDYTEYSLRIKQLQYILSIRADIEMKALLLSIPVRIINRGRAEAFTQDKVIYLDMAILDLLAHFSDELSLAEVKKDLYHQLAFNLAYAAALNGDKKLPLLDAQNTMKYTEEQKAYLWNEKQIAEKVIFDNILGFILAHEFGHLKLNHENTIKQSFPDEKDRSTGNLRWISLRRGMESAADEIGARLCLNALIQPAMLIPWLDLNEIRRRYYGKSAEYPTTAHRIGGINKVYVDIVGVDAMKGDLRDYNPLPPHRDVAQIDYKLFLNEYLKVRNFRKSLLIELDRIIVSLIKEQFPLDQIATTFFIFVERQKDLLKGVTDAEVLDQLIQMIFGSDNKDNIDIPTARSLTIQTGIGEYALEMIHERLEENSVDWKEIGGYLNVLKNAAPQFYDGISYEYLLANSIVRWIPELFSTIQAVLPEQEMAAKTLKPYCLDRPVRAPLPTYEQKLKVLKSWDGKYPNLSTINEK